MTDQLPKAQANITLQNITMGNDKPFVLFGGMNVLESKDLAFEIAETYIDICQQLDIGYVFKASFDKANRSSLYSFRGPGMEKGIEWLADIKKTYKKIAMARHPDKIGQMNLPKELEKKALSKFNHVNFSLNYYLLLILIITNSKLTILTL